jgi:ATP-binding cassette subfamily B protein
MYSANTLVYTLGALYFMFRISPSLTIWAFLPLPVVSVVVQYFGSRIHERFERIQAMFAEISARAQENFSGARVVRAFVQEQAEIEAFENANREYIRRSLKLVRLMGMLWPTLETLLGSAVVLVLWLGGRQVLQGRMDVGMFVSFNTYLVQLSWPIISVGWVLNLFQRGSASMGRINEIFAERPEIRDHVRPDAAPGEIRGDIEFRNLRFAYNGVPVLDGISLKVPAGSSLAVVGATGSGKSTLVSLIPRLYDAPPGTLLVDGVPIRQIPLQTLREQIGFVPQETFLFSESVRDNIRFGTHHATDQDVERAAEISNLLLDIRGFPKSFDTLVGERGLTLSGGQKQRTAISRAVIRDPRILILDDALSSVDTYTEEKILRHLTEVMAGRTTLLISHRVSTIRNADEIVVLHDGEIVERGSHEELLAKNGHYTELYNKQLIEEELEQEA